MAPKCPAPKRHGAEFSSAESAVPKRRRRNSPPPVNFVHKRLLRRIPGPEEIVVYVFPMYAEC